MFEPSIAFRLRTDVRPSTLPGAGSGIFSLENVPRGSLLGMDFPDYRNVCTDRDIAELSEGKSTFSWRHIEHVCFKAHERRAAADIVNHSFDPNIHWHLGYYFAAEEIHAGDELFLDYRYLVAPSWDIGMFDAKTGKKIEGMEWREMLIHSSRKLLELIEETRSTAEPEDLDRISELCLALRNLEPLPRE